MNAPFPNFARAQSIFDRLEVTARSIAEIDEQTAKVSAQEEKRIYASLLTNDELAQKISDDIPGYMDTETIVLMVRAALSGDSEKVRDLLMSELDDAVKREAESIAIKELEAA